ncbi:hypothetical protein JCM10207_001872 [Rhodosporidiobolus poonsookiae]
MPSPPDSAPPLPGPSQPRPSSSSAQPPSTSPLQSRSSPPASPRLSVADDAQAPDSDAEDGDGFDYSTLDALGLPRIRPPPDAFLGDMDDWEGSDEEQSGSASAGTVEGKEMREPDEQDGRGENGAGAGAGPTLDDPAVQHALVDAVTSLASPTPSGTINSASESPRLNGGRLTGTAGAEG